MFITPVIDMFQLDIGRDVFFWQVIANMTVGKDVSALFADVVNCIQTDNVELKKLVYLQLGHWSKQKQMPWFTNVVWAKCWFDVFTSYSIICLILCDILSEGT